ncbi:hypothetical protein Tco_1043995 [Tanacetum coccineum]|uniref:Transposase (putative) gypsy type domain-containing protein n=1 Tax=Tanacetum coccineum TaxID=301880 RepID=A0ABQ5GNP2_9ASTR
MPTRKIGVYIRFFEFANFRLPLSTFLVNVLRHYRINLSQLSVIAAAKVSHFEILCRVHGIEPTVGLFRCFYVNSKNKGWMSFSKRPDSDAVCYTKPLDSLKRWNDHFFWVNSFACPASFLWHTDKNVSRDPFPKSAEFSADDYAVLVAHPAPFQKFPEPFLCLIGMSQYILEIRYWTRGKLTPLYIEKFKQIIQLHKGFKIHEINETRSSIECLRVVIVPTRLEWKIKWN